MTDNAQQIFSLNASSSIPIYRQIIDQMREAIRLGLLQEGEQVPSVRTLAKALEVNPMTISKAFNLLEVEGFLVRQRGVGMRVGQVEAVEPTKSKLNRQLDKFIESAKEQGLSNDEILTRVQQYLSLHHKE